MNRRALHTTTIALLVSVFVCFNIGIPMVKYLCPLMSDDQPVCPMSMHRTSDGPVILPPSADCCGQYVIAERNTTPYVSQQTHQMVALDAVQMLVPPATTPVASGLAHSFVVISSVSTTADPPLFLLHSSLLI